MTDYEKACIEDFFTFIKTACLSDDYIGTIVYNISLSNGDTTVKSVRIDLDKVIVWDGWPPDNDVTVDTSCTFDTFYGLYAATLDPTNAVLTGKVSVKSWRYRQLSTIMSKFDFSTDRWDTYYAQYGKPDLTEQRKEFLRLTDPNQPAETSPEELYDQQCSQFQDDMTLVTPTNIAHLRELMGLSPPVLHDIQTEIAHNSFAHFAGSSSNLSDLSDLSEEDQLKSTLEQLSREQAKKFKLNLASQYLLDHIHTQEQQSRHNLLFHLHQALIDNQSTSSVENTIKQISDSLALLVDQSITPLRDAIYNASPSTVSSFLLEQLTQYLLTPFDPSTSIPISTTPTTTTTIPDLNIHPTMTVKNTSTPEQVDNIPESTDSSLFPRSQALIHSILMHALPLAALRAFHCTDNEFYLHSHVAWQSLFSPLSTLPSPTSTAPHSPLNTPPQPLSPFSTHPVHPIHATLHYPPDVYNDIQPIKQHDQLNQSDQIPLPLPHHPHFRLEVEAGALSDGDPSKSDSPVHDLPTNNHNTSQFPPLEDDDSPDSNLNTLQRTKVISQLISYPSDLYQAIKTNYAPTYNPHPTENVSILVSKFQSQFQYLRDVIFGDFRNQQPLQQSQQQQQQQEQQHLHNLEPISPPILNISTHNQLDTGYDDDEAFNQSVKQLVDVFSTNPALLQHSSTSSSPSVSNSLLLADENCYTPILTPSAPQDVSQPLSIDQLKLEMIKMRQKFFNFAQDFKDDIGLIRDDLQTEYRQVFQTAIGDDLEKNVEKMRILTQYMQYQLMLYRAALEANVDRTSSVQSITSTTSSTCQAQGSILSHSHAMHHHHHHYIPQFPATPSQPVLDQSSAPKALSQEELLYHNIAALSLAAKHLQVYHHTHHYFTHRDGEPCDGSKLESPASCVVSPISLDDTFVDPLLVFSSHASTSADTKSKSPPFQPHQSPIAWKHHQQQQQSDFFNPLEQTPSRQDFNHSDYIPLKDKGRYFKKLVQSKLAKVSGWYDQIDSSWLSPISRESESDSTPQHPIRPLEQDSNFVHLAHPYDLYMYTPGLHLDEIVGSGANNPPAMQSALFSAAKALYLQYIDRSRNNFRPFPRLPFSLQSNSPSTSLRQNTADIPPTLSIDENPLHEIEYYLKLGYPLESAVVFVATGLVQSNVKIDLEPEAFVIHDALKKDTITFYTSDEIAHTQCLRNEQQRSREDEQSYNEFTDLYNFPTNFQSPSPTPHDSPTLSDPNSDLPETTISRYYYQYLEPNQDGGVDLLTAHHYSSYLYDKLYPPHTRVIVPAQEENAHSLSLSLDHKHLAIYLFHKKNSSFLWYYFYPMIQKYTRSVQTFIFDPLLRWMGRKSQSMQNLVISQFHPCKEVLRDDDSQQFQPQLTAFQQSLLPHLRSSPQPSSSVVSLPTIPLPPDLLDDSDTTLTPVSQSQLLSQEESDRLFQFSKNHTSSRMTDFVEKLYSTIIKNRYGSIFIETDHSYNTTNQQHRSDQPQSPQSPQSRAFQHFYDTYPAFNEETSESKKNADGCNYFLPFPALSTDSIDNIVDLWFSHSVTEYLAVPTKSNQTPSTNTTYSIKHQHNPFSLARMQYKLIQNYKHADQHKQQQNYLRYRDTPSSHLNKSIPQPPSAAQNQLLFSPHNIPSPHLNDSTGAFVDNSNTISLPTETHHNPLKLASSVLSATAQLAFETLSTISSQITLFTNTSARDEPLEPISSTSPQTPRKTIKTAPSLFHTPHRSKPATLTHFNTPQHESFASTSRTPKWKTFYKYAQHNLLDDQDRFEL